MAWDLLELISTPSLSWLGAMHISVIFNSAANNLSSSYIRFCPVYISTNECQQHHIMEVAHHCDFCECLWPIVALEFDGCKGLGGAPKGRAHWLPRTTTEPCTSWCERRKRKPILYKCCDLVTVYDQILLSSTDLFLSVRTYLLNLLSGGPKVVAWRTWIVKSRGPVATSLCYRHSHMQ